MGVQTPVPSDFNRLRDPRVGVYFYLHAPTYTY